MEEYKLPKIILPKIKGFNWFPNEEECNETGRTVETHKKCSKIDAKTNNGNQE